MAGKIDYNKSTSMAKQIFQNTQCDWEQGAKEYIWWKTVMRSCIINSFVYATSQILLEKKTKEYEMDM
jgi:hypothetical protein